MAVDFVKGGVTGVADGVFVYVGPEGDSNNARIERRDRGARGRRAGGVELRQLGPREIVCRVRAARVQGCRLAAAFQPRQPGADYDARWFLASWVLYGAVGRRKGRVDLLYITRWATQCSLGKLVTRVA